MNAKYRVTIAGHATVDWLTFPVLGTYALSSLKKNPTKIQCECPYHTTRNLVLLLF